MWQELSALGIYFHNAIVNTVSVFADTQHQNTQAC